MKIRKVFEKFYIRINNLPSDIHFVPKKEYKKVKKFFPNLIYMGDNIYQIIYKKENWKRCISIFTDDAKDEWYYVRMYDIEVHLEENTLWGRYQLANPKIFKCDQWEGLIEFIKNEFIK